MEIEIEGFRFTSNFDSGNLARVELIPKELSKNRPLSSRTLFDALNSVPSPEHRFNLWTWPDCAGTPYENLNRSWFHFGIQTSHRSQCAVQFIMQNLNKHTRLYSHGMAPVYCTLPTNPNYERIPYQPSYWVEDGQFYMSFIHILPGDPEITTYFAFTYPYSYEKLQKYLQILDDRFYDPSDKTNQCSNDQIYYARELVCNSLEGRRVDLITVTSHHGVTDEREPFLPCLFPLGRSRPHLFKNKRVVFLSARVHPGETPSSYVLNGFLDFILKEDDKRAAKLRKMYIFKLIPMLNPDGVVKGHYRTDTRGVNLNRVYKDPIFEYHPSIFAVKALVLYYHIAYRVQCKTSISRSNGLHRNHSWSASSKKGLDICRVPSKYFSTKKSKASNSNGPLLEKHHSDDSISRKSSCRSSLSVKNSKAVAIFADNTSDLNQDYWNTTSIVSTSPIFGQTSENTTAEMKMTDKPVIQTCTSVVSNENTHAKTVPMSLLTPEPESVVQEQNFTAQVSRDKKISSVAFPFVASHLSTPSNSPHTSKDSKTAGPFLSDVTDANLVALNDRDKFLTFSSDWNVFVENIIQIRTELIETLRELRETMTSSLTKTFSDTSAWSNTTEDESLSPTSPQVTSALSSPFFTEDADVSVDKSPTPPVNLSSNNFVPGDNVNLPSWNISDNIKAETGLADTDDKIKSCDSVPKILFGTHLIVPEFSTAILPQRSGVMFYIDMHGHASKRGCFIYGNHFADTEDKIECMLFPKILSINCGCFDFSSCNFSQKNMYSTDKRDGTSKEGSGRVAIHKMTQIIRSYTLECNYNTGHFNRISPKTGTILTLGSNPIPLHVMYKPEVYQQVGRSLALTMLDMEGIPNTGTKLAISDYKEIGGVRDWLRHHIKSNDSPVNSATHQPRSKNPISQNKGGSSSRPVVTTAKKAGKGQQRRTTRTVMAVKAGQGDGSIAFSMATIKRILESQLHSQPCLFNVCSSLSSANLVQCASCSRARKKLLHHMEPCRKSLSELSIRTNPSNAFASAKASSSATGIIRPTSSPHPCVALLLLPGNNTSTEPSEVSSHKTMVITSSHPRKRKKHAKSKILLRNAS